jgi:hypothetical protein
MKEAIETLQETLAVLVESDLYDERPHLYYCLANRIVASIRALKKELGKDE